VVDTVSGTRSPPTSSVIGTPTSNDGFNSLSNEDGDLSIDREEGRSLDDERSLRYEAMKRPLISKK